jgi:hypothetical protein
MGRVAIDTNIQQFRFLIILESGQAKKELY